MQVQAFSANGSTPKPMGIAGPGQPPISGILPADDGGARRAHRCRRFGVVPGLARLPARPRRAQPTMAAGLAYSP